MSIPESFNTLEQAQVSIQFDLIAMRSLVAVIEKRLGDLNLQVRTHVKGDSGHIVLAYTDRVFLGEGGEWGLFINGTRFMDVHPSACITAVSLIPALLEQLRDKTAELQKGMKEAVDSLKEIAAVMMEDKSE